MKVFSTVLVFSQNKNQLHCYIDKLRRK